MPDLSRKRLQAIEQFSDLGSGIHIAMKDLDIRGAGDLLGAEQSGFVNDIGFETYHKILEEAVRELKDEHFKELFADAQEGSHALARGSRRDQSTDCVIETDLTMLIPASYVVETAERLALYRRLDDIRNETELQQFATGSVTASALFPHEVNELMEAIRLRWLGQRMGLEKMVLRRAICEAPSSPTKSIRSSPAIPSMRCCARYKRSRAGSKYTKRQARCGSRWQR